MSGRGLAELRRHPARYAPVLSAIAIAVAFLVACLVFLATEQRAMERSVLGSAARADLVAVHDPTLDAGDWTAAPADITRRLAAVPGVEKVEAQLSGVALVNGHSLQLFSTPSPEFGWVGLSSGRWPQTPEEIVLAPELAQRLGVGAGGTLRATVSAGEHDREQTYTVVGITERTRSLLSGLSDLGFVTSAALADAPSATWTIRLAPGADAAAVSAAAASRLAGMPLRVITTHAYAHDVLQGLTAGVDVFRAILLTFGAIGVLVGSIIIANTFTILVAQRRRWIGLLRAVGASTRQVRADLAVEALLSGAVGATLGLALGTGLAAVGAALSGPLSAGLALPGSRAGLGRGCGDNAAGGPAAQPPGVPDRPTGSLAACSRDLGTAWARSAAPGGRGARDRRWGRAHRAGVGA